MIVLDSSALIHLFSGTKEGQEIGDKILNQAIAVATPSINEVLIGVKGQKRQDAIEFFKSIEVLPFDEKSAYLSVAIEDGLIKKGRIIDKMDIFIASICLLHDTPLITTDKDFKNFEGLDLILV